MATNSGNIIRVACRNRYKEVADVVNVLHFTVEDVPGTLDDDKLLTDVSSLVSEAWGSLSSVINAGLEPYLIDVYNISQDYPIGQTIWSLGLWSGGGASGDPLPEGVAALVIWPTSVKRVQGKSYIGVMSEASLTGGTFTSATVSALEDWADILMSQTVQTNGYSFGFGIWSRVGGTMTQPNGKRISTLPAYQRRRRIGRGS